MSLYNPMLQMEELNFSNFRMYIANLLLAAKRQPPFDGEKGKERLNDFDSVVRDIFGNKKFLNDAGRTGRYIILGKKAETLQSFCDQILVILFDRRNDLKNMKINSNDDYFLFLHNICNFSLSEENLPNFINLIFKLASGGTIFSKAGDDEKAREWLDKFEFNI